MFRYFRARYLAPGLIALVMVTYGAITSVRSTRANLKDNEDVQASYRVLVKLQAIRSSVLDAETGQRGYVISRDQAFLQPYLEARKNLLPLITQLSEWTANDPIHQQRIGAMRVIAAERLEELEITHQLSQGGGYEAAAARIASGRGKQLMDRLRNMISVIETDEIALLDERQSRMAASFRETNLVLLATNGIAVLAVAIGGVMLILVIVSRDRERELEGERATAVAADRAKTDFLAMMSHEIRTPMNAILGFGELLQDEVQEPQQKHYANAIVSSGNSLLMLINDILDLSKIEAAKLELRPETVEMKRFAESLETLFSFRAAEKGLNYSVALDNSCPRLLFFDSLRLRQVLVNLIGNAIKFTREGEVTVRITPHETSGDEVRLRIEVNDTGVGIAAENIESVFRPFYQVEEERMKLHQGTGLGLSISRRLTELMGGTIELESELGKGSKFTLEVPTINKMPSGHDRDPADFESGKNIDFEVFVPFKVLVVDDVPLNRELIRGYLRGTGHQVIEAENGEQAVTMCRRHSPDLVLMDIRMPGMDGRAAHAILKAADATKKIPLVAVTASSLLNSQQQLKQMFDGFASKPVSRERLFVELSRFLPKKAIEEISGNENSAENDRVLAKVVANSFELEETRRWPELREDLEALCSRELPGLIEQVRIQATRQFALKLTILASDHDCPPLAMHAMELHRVATEMDFGQTKRLLRQTEALATSLTDAKL